MCAKSHAIGRLKTVTPREQRARRPFVEGKTGMALTSTETAMELGASPIRDRLGPLSGGQVLRSQIGMERRFWPRRQSPVRMWRWGPDWRLAPGVRIERAMRQAPANGRMIGGLIRLMKERDVILEPNLFRLASLLAQARERGGEDSTRLEAQLAYAAAVTRRAHRAGVRIAAGSGALGGETPNLRSELYLLVSLAGLTPQEALIAATPTNADALRLPNDNRLRGLGEVGQATPADLVIYDRDPTLNIRNTQSIVAVVRVGRLLIRDEPMSAAPLTGE